MINSTETYFFKQIEKVALFNGLDFILDYTEDGKKAFGKFISKDDFSIKFILTFDKLVSDGALSIFNFSLFPYEEKITVNGEALETFSFEVHLHKFDTSSFKKMLEAFSNSLNTSKKSVLGFTV